MTNANKNKDAEIAAAISAWGKACDAHDSAMILERDKRRALTAAGLFLARVMRGVKIGSRVRVLTPGYRLDLGVIAEVTDMTVSGSIGASPHIHISLRGKLLKQDGTPGVLVRFLGTNFEVLPEDLGSGQSSDMVNAQEQSNAGT